MVGWRDPYIFEVKGEGDFEEWGILIGSGHKKTGGTVMIYRSAQLSSGASYQTSGGSGLVLSAADRPADPAAVGNAGHC